VTVFGPALEAADFALTQVENRIDALVGRGVRLTIGRYMSAIVLGVPTAWLLNGMKWNLVATLGLMIGITLFGIVDTVKIIARRRRSRDV
jgi:hypothetical protein